MIPSLSLESGDLYIYKTAHHERLRHDYKVSAAQVALATSAAPTLLPAHRSTSGVSLIDGGVWANNPTGLAVVEAIGLLEWSVEDIRVLSLGCTSEVHNFGRGRLSRGLLYWGPRASSLFLSAQSKGSMGTAYTLLRGHENVVRISPNTAPGRFGVDHVASLDSLRGLGAEVARTELSNLQKAGFFSGPAAKFEPVYRLS